MSKPMTTLWKNIQGRAEFLTRVEERMNCGQIKGEILTEAQQYAYAICEELEELTETLQLVNEVLTNHIKMGGR